MTTTSVLRSPRLLRTAQVSVNSTQTAPYARAEIRGRSLTSPPEDAVPDSKLCLRDWNGGRRSEEGRSGTSTVSLNGASRLRSQREAEVPCVQEKVWVSSTASSSRFRTTMKQEDKGEPLGQRWCWPIPFQLRTKLSLLPCPSKLQLARPSIYRSLLLPHPSCQHRCSLAGRCLSRLPYHVRLPTPLSLPTSTDYGSTSKPDSAQSTLPPAPGGTTSSSSRKTHRAPRKTFWTRSSPSGWIAF